MNKFNPIWTFHCAHLSPAERGALADIAVNYGKYGKIPKDDAGFAQLVGITVEEWRELSKPGAWGILGTWKIIKPMLFPAGRKSKGSARR